MVLVAAPAMQANVMAAASNTQAYHIDLLARQPNQTPATWNWGTPSAKEEQVKEQS